MDNCIQIPTCIENNQSVTRILINANNNVQTLFFVDPNAMDITDKRR